MTAVEIDLTKAFGSVYGTWARALNGEGTKLGHYVMDNNTIDPVTGMRERLVATSWHGEDNEPYRVEFTGDPARTEWFEGGRRVKIDYGTERDCVHRETTPLTELLAKGLSRNAGDGRVVKAPVAALRRLGAPKPVPANYDKLF